MLLRKYNNIEYIFNLYFLEGYEFILKALEIDLDKSIWDRWLVDYSKMDSNNFKSFDEYKKHFTKSIITEKQLTKEELLAKAERIQEKISRKRGEDNSNRSI